MCLPFGLGKKSRRRLTYSEKSAIESYTSQRSSIDRLGRADSLSRSPTLTSHHADDKVTFSSDSESYNLEGYHDAAREVTARPVLRRAATTKAAKTTVAPPANNTPQRKWTYGYGWGVGKKEKDRERERELQMQRETEKEDSLNLTRNTSQESRPPLYQSPRGSGSKHSKNSSEATRYVNPLPPQTTPTNSRSNTFRSNMTSGKSNGRRPGLHSNESSSTLVGSLLERKINDLDVIPERADTTGRLEALRDLMKKDNLDY